MKRIKIRELLDLHKNGSSSLLFIDAEHQDAWWREINASPSYKPMVDEIRQEAARLLRERTPELTCTLFRIFNETGSRLEYERAYFERRKRLNTFALISLLEPEKTEYHEALHNILWSICDEYTWCLPAHLKGRPETFTEINYSLKAAEERPGEPETIDLFAAETGFALSEIMKLTERSLPELLRKRIYQEVYRRIFLPLIRHGPYDWEKATHNWSAVCGGSVGAAALHLMDNSDDLAIILERVLQAVTYYLKGFQEDGACTEGYTYWQYGFGYFVYFADLLKKRTAGSIDLFSLEKVHQIALFQEKCFLSGNTVVNFSDSLPEARVFLGLSHFLKGVYPDLELPQIKLRTRYTDDHCSRWAPAIRNLLWVNPREHGQPWRAATYYLDNAQWFISRHVAKSRYYSFAAKGGHNEEPHNHNDIGHFILHADGETFLADLGCGMYTDEYFGPKRYSFVCNGSHGHSVPIINGQYQVEGISRRAIPKQVSFGTDLDLFELDFASAYAVTELQQLKRRYSWRKSVPMLLLEDNFIFSEKPGSITERLITLLPPQPEDENCFILTGKQQRLRIRFDSGVMEPKARSIQYTDHFGRQVERFALDLEIRRPERHCTTCIMFEFE
ncbi:heparinase II/III family protein [Paenactinomyces guangxiensis]|uniref:Heparinase II/III family protein n=1 Tax=Paenactinomyces guangxiensis TaxID=1490290 RepID=A0A7W1WNU2_9BACL|nr:heparinase II/III family protein [Paenactinomyces guangxiensis]MBA4493315.1 heparinase II/III family protein [Paenactinomyces guangxiensis]MBH8589834.1 heparinase II/III family protein [Paenactinomyces guangxiensis]